MTSPLQWNDSSFDTLQGSVTPRPWQAENILLDLETRTVGPSSIVPFNLGSAISRSDRNGGGRRKSSLPAQAFGALYIPESVFETAGLNVSKKSRVTGYLQRACAQAGFSIAAYRARKNQSGSMTRHIYYCSHGRCKGPSNVPDSKRQRKRKFTRPDPATDEVCPFRFTILENIDTGDWFFPPKVDGNNLHKGHHQLPSKYVRVSTKALKSSEIDALIQEASLNIVPSQLQELLQRRTGITLTTSQIGSLRRSQRQLCIETSSAAGRLLKQLKEDPVVDFCVHTAHRSEAGHITIRSYSNVDLASLAEDAKLNSTTARPRRSHVLSAKEVYAKAVIEALAIPGTSNLLLCVAWATRKQVEWFSKFPSQLSLDVVHGTNAEKRPVARGTVKTPNNNTVPVVNCFMPAEASWVFDWLLEEALPHLFGKKILSQIRMVLTDQDLQCVNMVNKQILTGYLCSARHRLCAWHKIDRGFSLHAARFRQHRGNIPLLDGATAFFWAMVEYPETVGELDFLKAQYLAWKQSVVNAGATSKDCRIFLNHFYKESFDPWLFKLSSCYFKGQEGGHAKVSSGSESENARLKGSSIGPRPNLSIDSSQIGFQNVECRALGQLEDAAWNALSQSSTGAPHSVEAGVQEVNDMSRTKLLQQYHMRSAYITCQDGNGNFLVRCKHPSKQHKPNDKRPGLHVLPKIWRTRTVKIVDSLATCSCMMYETEGLMCRHLYAVTQLVPTNTHCLPRHHKSHEVFYGVNEQYTKESDALIAVASKGVFIPADTELPTIVPSEELAWYTEGLQMCLVPGSPAYTSSRSSLFSSNPCPLQSSPRKSPGVASIAAAHDSTDSDTETPNCARTLDFSHEMDVHSRLSIREVRQGPLGNINPKHELVDLAQLCAQVVDDLSTYDTVYNCFVQGLKVAMQMKAARSSNKPTSGRLHSLIETDNRKQAKRQTHALSPVRKKAKRKQNLTVSSHIK